MSFGIWRQRGFWHFSLRTDVGLCAYLYTSMYARIALLDLLQNISLCNLCIVKLKTKLELGLKVKTCLGVNWTVDRDVVKNHLSPHVNLREVHII